MQHSRRKRRFIKCIAGEVHTTFMVVLVLAFFFLAFWEIGYRPSGYLTLRRPSGVTAPLEPMQISMNPPKSWMLGDSRIIALASFTLTARVLMNVAYTPNSDHFKLSPRDLVVSWGPWSDTEKLSSVKFGHGYRVVTWMQDNHDPIALGSHISHIHAIPATESVRSAIRSIDPEDIVRLTGYLVSVESPGYLPWTSSLSRFDSSCEIMWIDYVLVESKRPSLFEYFGRLINESMAK